MPERLTGTQRQGVAEHIRDMVLETEGKFMARMEASPNITRDTHTLPLYFYMMGFMAAIYISEANGKANRILLDYFQGEGEDLAFANIVQWADQCGQDLAELADQE